VVHLLKVPDAVQEPVLETEGEMMGFAKNILVLIEGEK
jgi:hypothetical protein